MALTRRKIGEILQRWGLVNEQQIQDALKVAATQRKRLGEVLVELGHVSETDIDKALGQQFNMEYIDLDRPDAISKDNLKLLPFEVIKKYLVLPIAQENGTIKIIIHDPTDLDTLDDLKFRLNCKVETALAARVKIKEYINQYLSGTEQAIKATIDQTIDQSIDKAAGSIDIQGLSIDGQMSVDTDSEAEAMRSAQQAPIVKLVNHIIAQAVTKRASDIHIEPFTDRVRLRYRIDGVCVEQERISRL